MGEGAPAVGRAPADARELGMEQDPPDPSGRIVPPGLPDSIVLGRELVGNRERFAAHADISRGLVVDRDHVRNDAVFVDDCIMVIPHELSSYAIWNMATKPESPPPAAPGVPPAPPPPPPSPLFVFAPPVPPAPPVLPLAALPFVFPLAPPPPALAVPAPPVCAPWPPPVPPVLLIAAPPEPPTPTPPRMEAAMEKVRPGAPRPALFVAAPAPAAPPWRLSPSVPPVVSVLA